MIFFAIGRAGWFPVTDGTPAERASRLAAAMSLIGIGWFLAASIVGGVVGGVLLDGWLHTKPAFTLLGLFGGLAVLASLDYGAASETTRFGSEVRSRLRQQHG